MSNTQPEPNKKRPFFQYLLISVAVLLSIVIVSIAFIDYTYTEKNFKENTLAIENQTEQNTVNIINIIGLSLKIFDSTLGSHLERSFIPFMEEYERGGRDPSRIDLGALKKQLGPDFELYIINESGVIEHSTVQSEIGLDFQKTVPYFYEYLMKVRNSSGFFQDRAVIEATTGKLKKYAYMPTPDHRYILELGFCDETFRSEWYKLRSIEAEVKNLSPLNPYLESIRVFTATNFYLLGNEEFVPGPSLRQNLDEITRTKKNIVIEQPDEGKTIKYLYIDLYDKRYGSDPSVIVEIIYNTSLIQKKLDEILLYHFVVAIIALIVSLAGALIVSRSLMRPIQTIVDDVNIIAGGDLDHTISPAIGREFAIMEQSINMMVAKLKGTIEQLRESEARIWESEERYRKTSSLISDYAYSVKIEPDGTFILEWGSGAVQNITGYAIEVLFARGGWKTIVHQGDKDLPQEHINRIFNNQPFRSEFRIISRQGGIRWVSHYTQPDWDPGQNRVVRFYAAGQDITQRKRIEEDILKLNEELEKRVAARTAELEDSNNDLESFSYTVSHDLRAPLRAIDGYSLILAEKYKPHLSPDAISYLQKIRQNTEKMALLIDDLLNFSRLGRLALNKETIFLEDLFRQSLDELSKELIGREVAVQFGDLPPCQGDRAMLKQVCLNLLSNALKFTRTRPVAQIDIGSYREDNRIFYYINDNGVGFDMRYVSKVFEVFQQLHTTTGYEGTGVGLAIVKKIIERHGGKIWVQSDVDRGTTFFFTLDEGN